MFGATKNGDTLVKNQLLAPNSQAKLQTMIGPQKAQDLITALQQEDALAQKSNRIVGGSPTHQNMQGSVVSGPAAIPGKVANYISNFALDRPGSWIGMTPGSIISQGEAAAMAKARGQLAPILTTPNGPNAAMANALLEMAGSRANRAEAAGQIGDLATALISGAGREEAQKHLPSMSMFTRELMRPH